VTATAAFSRDIQTPQRPSVPLRQWEFTRLQFELLYAYAANAPDPVVTAAQNCQLLVNIFQQIQAAQAAGQNEIVPYLQQTLEYGHLLVIISVLFIFTSLIYR
jgi:hypothetical protein